VPIPPDGEARVLWQGKNIMGRSVAMATAAILLWSLGASDRVLAAEIGLLSPGAMMSSLKQLVPQFEKSSGHKVTVTYAPALALADRIKKGESADVVILGEGPADALLKAGRLVAGSKVVIARVGVGVFVRRGDPRPDVSTFDAFNRALLSAKIITYSDPSLGGTASNYVSGLLESLDVTGSIKPKIKLAVQYRSIADFVANGGADFGLNQIAEIVADPRLELAGPLPDPIQRYTYYTASLVAIGDKQSAGKELIDFLASPAASDTMRSRGFEPL
jgi:molybdate transport system substrate-binding protein